ncbi:MAG: DUF1833 family protein [Exiguobacterium profundum]|nr:MAG: DUF1833 family protein [Exiguobacterium profundum]
MPDLSEALREAYASAPVGLVIHDTLEFWHPAFATPIRVVRTSPRWMRGSRPGRRGMPPAGDVPTLCFRGRTARRAG